MLLSLKERKFIFLPTFSLLSSSSLLKVRIMTRTAVSSNLIASLYYTNFGPY